jgi:NAD(P)-dependent dehydrogenase (short-subunit alcohol dehydrogenase family)
METKPILITGASSDIGCAVVRRILDRPDGPIVLAHSFASRNRLATLQTEYGDRLQLLQADFSQRSSVEAMADRIATDYGTPAEIVHLRPYA